MEKNILLAASFYTRSYYLNPRYDRLPTDVKRSLQAAAALAAESARGILSVTVERGDFRVSVEREENDFDYDEIGARAAANRFADEQAELLRGVALWRKLERLL